MMSKPKLWLHGCTGRMGHEIQKLLSQETASFDYVGGSTKTFHGMIAEKGQAVNSESLIQAWRAHKIRHIQDFSTPQANLLLLHALRNSALNEDFCILIGTTGMPQDQIEDWKALSREKKLRVLWAPNTSVGILMLVKTALLAAGIATKLDFDLEIVETHHRYKQDLPSGTAKFLAESLARNLEGYEPTYMRDGARKPQEIGVHAVRGGGVFGEHTIRLLGAHEELSLSHRAFSRSLFASGAITLSKWLSQQAIGFYELSDVHLEELPRSL